MKLFLDSAKTDEIAQALAAWNIDGITTNPRHVRDSGEPRRRVLAQIAELVSGTDKPVSVEVNPHLTEWEAIVREGIDLHRLSPNFVIKVGASESGFRAMRALAEQRIPVNATLIFSAAQAWHAARVGAAYVSPFLGWREAYGDDARSLLCDTLAILRVQGYATQVIAAAIRNTRQLVDAAAAGAHCATAAYGVWQESFRNPYTDQGEKVFRDAWDATPP